ncbi:protein transport protein Sec61 subunit beta-like [Panicum virgatum]|uniref:Protein transport protein Sec61 subunit beta n=1 Tax=Panicum virgatum TaxID=38727 RepID=A0A8T0TCD5_PANVG|nr:protein transport protein Sec61 subunit beta-like [Panicum virgatum]KAG2607907.1 hypothetical protein PVAP13_4NG297200 [Panicum virgatum]
MAANGDAPARGSAAAAASLRRRRATSGAAAGGGGASSMLQFYTDEAAGRKMFPNTVLIMSIGFVAVVAVLHVFGKLYRTVPPTSFAVTVPKKAESVKRGIL